MATEVEFRTMKVALKIRMYSTSPRNSQGTHCRLALHSPYFACHSVKVNQGDLMSTERALPKSWNGPGPGGKGYPLLPMRFRRILRIVSTVKTVSNTNTVNWAAEVDHSMSSLRRRSSGIGIRSSQGCRLLETKYCMPADTCGLFRISSKRNQLDEVSLRIPNSHEVH